jgi:hypothetical protein
MKTFEKKFKELQDEAIHTIKKLIETKGEESDHNGKKCLKITDENYMYNLEGGRYLCEINSEYELIDNDGFEYNIHVLEIEQFMFVVDYLKEKYG